MSETLLANLFFIITGSAILVVVAFLCVVLYQVLKVVRMARDILDRVHTGAEMLVEDAKMLREQIANGSITGRVVTAVMGAIASVANLGGRRAAARKKRPITQDDNA